MPTTWNAINLGLFGVMDSTAGNANVESPATLDNAVYGSAADPLYKKFVTITPSTTQTTYTQVSNRGSNNTAYDAAADGQSVNSNGTGAAWIEYFREINARTNTGEVPTGTTNINHAYDGLREFNATITYTDGTTANVTALLFQDWNGQTYWAPEATQNADQNAMEAKPIQSLTVGSATTTQAALGANRDVWQYAVCFAAGTMIDTVDGQKPVEALKAGDLVMTADHGLQPIRWIGSRKLTAANLEIAPNLRPIRIAAGALGKNSPESDLVVSPQHRILVRSKIAQRMFGTDEVLVAAKQILEIDGVEIAADLQEVEYFHFLFDQHEVVKANGAMTESLFTGPEALKAVSREARDEILGIFPELRDETAAAPSARVIANGRMGRQLATRHISNQLDLVS